MSRAAMRGALCLAATALATGALAQDQTDAHAVLSEPPVFERSSDVAVPLWWRAGKLAMEATANGTRREFLFDTGSPTILSADLARNLGLTVLGRNVGQDANGRRVAMDIARLDQLQIGGLMVRDMPVLIFDFSALEIGSCIVDGGVIGSDVLPAGAWTVDMESGTLSLSDAAPSAAAAAPLETYGYPHAPIVAYRIGDLTDRALIDTGGSGTLTLYDRAMDAVARALPPGAVRTGQAVAGESAGGRGDQTTVRLARIEDLTVGELKPDTVLAGTRPVAPTLIGVDILRTHRMTLDQPRATVGFTPREHADERPADLGLGVEWIGGEAVVTRLMADSAASRAGLRLGDRVLRANGRDLADAADPCGQALWLIEHLAWASGMTLTIARAPDRMLRLEP